MIKFSSQNNVTECAKEKQQWIKIESEKNGWHVPKCFQILHIDAIHSSVMSSWFVVLLSCYNFTISTSRLTCSPRYYRNWLHEFVNVNFCALFCVECLEKALNGKSMIEWNQKYQNTVLWNISWYSFISVWSFEKCVKLNILKNRLYELDVNGPNLSPFYSKKSMDT